MPILLQGDVREKLSEIPDSSIQCVVTSPPYWGLRDYGVSGQLGLERTPGEYVAKMVEVFAAVRRVLRDDGVLWLNLGDSYTTGGSTSARKSDPKAVGDVSKGIARIGTPEGLKPKDLVGIPWQVAFALQADGWYLRSDVIWAKPNPMPESVKDRPTRSHEYLFLLTKNERYYYDAQAIEEPATYARPNAPDKIKSPHGQGFTRRATKQDEMQRRAAGFNGRWKDSEGPVKLTRNARSVWTIATRPYKGAHFATFPEELARRCILAGSKIGDRILDPFGGSGTVAAVAQTLGREATYIDLNPAYLDLARQRIANSIIKL